MATSDNLMSAFAGESQANRKYLAFAKKADKDKLLEAIGTIEALPVESMAGDLAVPVAFSTGAAVNFMVVGEKKLVEHDVAQSPERELTEYETVVLRQIREKVDSLTAKGMSRQDIAKRAGIADVTLAKWYSGRNFPRKKESLRSLLSIEVQPGKLGQPPRIDTPTRRKVERFCSMRKVSRQDFCLRFEIDPTRFDDFMDENWHPENAREILQAVNAETEKEG